MLLQVLREEFKKRKERNPQYSLRAFARSLKIHSSTLSAILNEKRKITYQQAQKILAELGLNRQERKNILLKMIDEKTAAYPAPYTELSEDVIRMISGWEHFALLSCLDLDSTGKTTLQLATKIGLSLENAEQALERLEKFSLVKRKGAQWFSTGQSFTTTNEISSEAVRILNREYIHKALVSLDKNSIEDRHITGVTMAISSKKIATAKKMIVNFSRELADYLEADSRDEVYRLNIQFFPLSK
jgi:uncharacterized protein (TIGR02147 family)